jgi:hypothetical protein
MLAGVSVDHDVRLERGDLSGVSESVLEALARALQLDEAERGRLFDLARPANASPVTRRRTPSQRVRPVVQRILDSVDAPAWVRDGRGDFLAADVLGRSLCSEVPRDPARPANTAWSAFLSPRSRDFFVDGEGTADAAVSILRAEAGRNPHDKALTDLVGELELSYEGLELTADVGLTLFVSSVEPASISAGRLALLASRALSQDEEAHRTAAEAVTDA